MAKRSTTNWSLFPPETTEVQLDEKWAFVGKKEANCEPDEKDQGDNSDHVAFDPVHRFIVSFVPGKRTKANVDRLVEDFACRTEGRLMDLITSDEHKPYKVSSTPRCTRLAATGASYASNPGSSTERHRR